MNFSDILNKGKKRAGIKTSQGKWDRCEGCKKRRKVFLYIDNYGAEWRICGECVDNFVDNENCDKE